MSYISIIIIGLGQIGSRHLQGVAKINFDKKITIIDPNIDSISIAKKRYNEVNRIKDTELISLKSLEQLDDFYDIAIISTNSNVRMSILHSLLDKTQIKNIILEKVVFQRIDDFEKTIIRLKDQNIKVWVNCPRRMYPSYKEIKNKLSNSKKIKFTLEGSEWNLASNTIHFLDLFSFFINSYDLYLDGQKLYSNIYKSKKNDFIELGGELIVHSKRGDILRLIDYKYGIPEFKACLEFDKTILHIDENNCNYIEFSKDEKKFKKSHKLEVPLQSNLTNIQVEEILFEKISTINT